MKAAPTMYRGVEYRSRLEAKWAAFFDLIGWQHTYEPFDGDGYIPDFLIHGDKPLLVEIKPAVTVDEYFAPCRKAMTGLKGHWEHDILILGADPLPPQLRVDRPYPPAGLLGEFWDYWELVDGRVSNERVRAPKPEDWVHDWNFHVGNWFTCAECGRINIFHSIHSSAGRPCGDRDDDYLLGDIEADTIRGHWADATNLVKWHGRAA